MQPAPLDSITHPWNGAYAGAVLMREPPAFDWVNHPIDLGCPFPGAAVCKVVPRHQECNARRDEASVAQGSNLNSTNPWIRQASGLLQRKDSECGRVTVDGGNLQNTWIPESHLHGNDWACHGFTDAASGLYLRRNPPVWHGVPVASGNPQLNSDRVGCEVSVAGSNLQPNDPVGQAVTVRGNNLRRNDSECSVSIGIVQRNPSACHEVEVASNGDFHTSDSACDGATEDGAPGLPQTETMKKRRRDAVKDKMKSLRSSMSRGSSMKSISMRSSLRSMASFGSARQ